MRLAYLTRGGSQFEVGRLHRLESAFEAHLTQSIICRAVTDVDAKLRNEMGSCLRRATPFDGGIRLRNRVYCRVSRDGCVVCRLRLDACVESRGDPLQFNARRPIFRYMWLLP